MSDIDDACEWAIELDIDGEELSVVPLSAILKINDGGTQKTRTLTLSDGLWRYRVTDADLAEFGVGVLTARVHATFSDGSNQAFPCPPALLQIVIGEADPETA